MEYEQLEDEPQEQTGDLPALITALKGGQMLPGIVRVIPQETTVTSDLMHDDLYPCMLRRDVQKSITLQLDYDAMTSETYEQLNKFNTHYPGFRIEFAPPSGEINDPYFERCTITAQRKIW